MPNPNAWRLRWWVSGDGQLVGETVAYFSNESLCLKLERGAVYSVRRLMQREYCCYNFLLSYSIRLLLSLFLSFDLAAMGEPDGSD